MTSFYVICGLGLPYSKILGSLINRRSPEKIFEELFFRRTLAAVSLVLGLGLEHSCPWPREGLSSKRLSLALALDFFLCPWPWPRALCPRLHLWHLQQDHDDNIHSFTIAYLTALYCDYELYKFTVPA